MWGGQGSSVLVQGRLREWQQGDFLVRQGLGGWERACPPQHVLEVEEGRASSLTLGAWTVEAILGWHRGRDTLSVTYRWSWWCQGGHDGVRVVMVVSGC